jgi:cation diffusion facilitator CzcD-associated flavoprotein CzcO
LKADIRTKVESALRAGHDKAQIAEEFDISITSVTRVLLTTPGLQNEWHEEKYKQRGHIARQTWSDILQHYSFLGIKILRKLEPAAYAWLYRNDRDWLNNCLVNVPTRVLTNHAEKRIEKTDQRIADAVRRIAAQNVNQVWSLSELKRAIPSLRKVIINPGQWPCASQALRQILQLVKLKR